MSLCRHQFSQYFLEQKRLPLDQTTMNFRLGLLLFLFLFHFRCSCNNCQRQSTEEECLCRKECSKSQQKLMENVTLFAQNEQFDCITSHPGFEPVCLNPWVLQVVGCATDRLMKIFMRAQCTKNTDILLIDNLFIGLMVM